MGVSSRALLKGRPVLCGVLALSLFVLVLALPVSAAAATASGWFAQRSGTGDDLHGVTCSDASHAWAVGDNGTVLTTTDGGAQWIVQSSMTGDNLCGAACSDASHAWAVGYDFPGDGTVVATTDGGSTWNTQLNRSNWELHAVTCSDANHAWAVGYNFNAANGIILATTDGGSTWTTSPYPAMNTYLYGVTCSDANHAWAVGFDYNTGNGIILATTDGGATWHAQYSGTTANLYGVTCTDASHVWVVGANGVVLVTTDGGATWNYREAGTGSLYGVTSSDPRHAWAVGFGDSFVGTILATTDGGTTWHTQYDEAGEDLFGVTCSDASHAWAVGDDPAIVALDTTPPTTTVSGADDLWHKTPVKLTLTATDNPGGSGMFGGLATTEYRIDDGPWTTGTTALVPAPANHSGDGVQTVSYRSCDAAGNWETAKSVTVRIDTTAPTLSAIGASNGVWLNHAVTITLNAADDGGSGVASISYNLDGVPFVVTGSSTQLVLPVDPNANHLLTYQAADEVGNVSAQQSLTAHIDTVGPTTLVRPARGHRGKAIALRYLVRDNLSPQAKAVTLTIRNSHGRLVRRFTLGTKKMISKSYVVKWKPKARGAYRYTVTARDLAGNQQTTAGNAMITVK